MISKQYCLREARDLCTLYTASQLYITFLQYNSVLLLLLPGVLPIVCTYIFCHAVTSHFGETHLLHVFVWEDIIINSFLFQRTYLSQ